MTQKTRKILKSYFETGRVPSQPQYIDLIDSQLNLLDTSVQYPQGGLEVTGGVTSSGTLKGLALHIVDDADINDDLTVGGDVTIKGVNTEISGSGDTRFDVEGKITNSGSLSISGSALFQHTLQAEGNVDFNGDLDVDGTTNLDDTDIDGTLTIDGNTIFNTGTVNFKQPITASIISASSITASSFNAVITGDSTIASGRTGSYLANKIILGPQSEILGTRGTDLFGLHGPDNFIKIGIGGGISVGNTNESLMLSSSLLTLGAASASIQLNDQQEFVSQITAQNFSASLYNASSYFHNLQVRKGALLYLGFNDTYLKSSTDDDESLEIVADHNIHLMPSSSVVVFKGSEIGKDKFVDFNATSSVLDITGDISASGNLVVGGISNIDNFSANRISSKTSTADYIDFDPDFIRINASFSREILFGTVGTVLHKIEDSKTTFNSNGADIDFLVKGDSDNELFYVNAGTDRVGIGTDTPISKLEINGDITATHITASGNITASGTTINFHNLPTTDPLTTGSLWVSGSQVNAAGIPSGYVMISGIVGS